MYYVNNVHSKLLLYGEQILTLAIDVIVLKFYKIPLLLNHLPILLNTRYLILGYTLKQLVSFS